MKKVLMIVLPVTVLSLGIAAPSEAWHWGRPHVYPYWGYAYPYPYPYPYGYGPPVVIQREAPPVYVQPPSQQQYWYWCDNPKGYYPYVQQCEGGWMQVVPQTSPPTAPR